MCGIFGQINKKQGQFNFPAFATLGIANDSRGGDSCGVFIDGKTEYGVNDKKLFAKFIETSKLVNNTVKCNIALGHCRKASIGSIDLARAQPVVIKENNAVKFVLVHNGTIHNYKQLAAKYIPNINIDNMSDSQVMAQIFYHVGYDCLEEYTGGAVFVIVDYRTKEPTIYFFKGKSKYYTTSSTACDERPFYFVTVRNTILFSSIYTWLTPFAQQEQIYTIEPNNLIQVKDLQLFIIKTYNRENNIQTQQPVSNSYTNPYIQNVNKLHMESSGLYVQDGKLVHGLRYVEVDGTIKWSLQSKAIYFWHGRALINQEAFSFLTRFAQTSNIPEEKLHLYIPKTIHMLSFYPIFTHTISKRYLTDEIADTDLVWFNGVNYIPYTGAVAFLDDSGIASIIDGCYADYSLPDNNVTFFSMWENNVKIKLNTTELYSLIKTECEQLNNELDVLLYEQENK